MRTKALAKGKGPLLRVWRCWYHSQSLSVYLMAGPQATIIYGSRQFHQVPRACRIETRSHHQISEKGHQNNHLFAPRPTDGNLPPMCFRIVCSVPQLHNNDLPPSPKLQNRLPVNEFELILASTTEEEHAPSSKTTKDSQ